jgi:hypothetical protein
MEGFKTNPKMQCFKEGGQVKYETRKEHKEEVAADINQDKKIIKKAFSMHDKQEHKGEHTDLSKLKKGGRAKKSVGTVKKFDKASGQYGAKKTVADNKNIQQAKQFKVKKMADGGLTGQGAVSDYEREMIRPSLKGQGAISDFERSEIARKMNPGASAKGQGSIADAVRDKENQRQMDRIKRAQQYLDPSQQAEFAGQEREFLGRKKGGKVSK